MRFGLVFDDAFRDHRSPFPHPENAERLDAVLDGLRNAGLLDGATRIPARPARSDELVFVHDQDYVEMVLDAMENRSGFLDPDTFFSAGSRRASLLAAGGGIDLAAAVHSREVDWGWAVVRPPGHHAERRRPRGFCIFNNIAVAAAALLEGGARRVAIIDWDVHHANGTQDAFWNDPRVLLCSIHQWPHFPGSGRSEELGGGAAPGSTVNFPLPRGARDGDYLACFERVIAPLVAEHAPDHLLLALGFDADSRDPLAGHELTTAAFGSLAKRARDLARALCGGRITAFLEGGYDRRAIAEGSAAAAEALAGASKENDPTIPPGAEPSESGRSVIETTSGNIRDFWPGAGI